MKSFLLRVLFALAAVPGPWAAPAAAQPASVTGSAGYSLHPGDVVQVTIWREEDMSGEFLVDLRGNVTLPLLGARLVVGIPLDSLQAMLVRDYRVYLRNPSITVTPLRRVQVLGEVNKPGLYSVDPTVTVAGAVALAGGATPTGNLSRIRIVRDGRVYSQRVGPQTALAAADIRSGDQIFVERRSWFDRNSTFLVSALLSVTGIVISIINAT
jgi:protein involved in polysaccharide export with SLBB domain